MKAKKANDSGISKSRYLTIIGVALVLILTLALGARAYAKSYSDKIFPNVFVGSMDLGGLTKEKASERLNTYFNELQNRGLQFIYNQELVTLYPTMTPDGQIELYYDLVNWQADELVNQAWGVGRSKNPLSQIWSILRLKIAKKTLEPNWQIDSDKIKGLLNEKFGKSIAQSQDAGFKLENNQISITPETKGMSFDLNSAIRDLRDLLDRTNYPKVNLEAEEDENVITVKELNKLKSEVESLLALEKIQIKYDDKNWEATGPDVVGWLKPRREDDEVVLSFGGDKWQEWIDGIGKEINVEAKSAKFEMSNGRVTQFQGQQTGKEVDVEATKKLWEQDLLVKKQIELMLVVKETAPEVTAENVNDLGIKEIIGVGKSNFKGSPKNRRHNIAVGAGTLNGVLIKPDEEFSLVKTLGEIDGEHGYLPELVIKENKTIPEFGGGLCQIGTTTFRATMASGLPVLERQNHSYRVVYYEPAGTDATIYDPRPDFRFLNDTGHYVLIQTRIEGDNLTFEFWGTKDGREVEQNPNPPKLTNITSSGPAKYIATTDLAPGEKKRVETAHAGGTAEFTYKVTYSSGEVKEQVFKSIYKPWREIWMVGVDPANPVITCPEKVPNCQLVPLEGTATPPPATNENINSNVNGGVNANTNVNLNVNVPVDVNVNVNQ